MTALTYDPLKVLRAIKAAGTATAKQAGTTRAYLSEP